MPNVEYFRTDTLRGLPSESKVDRKTGTISGAKALQFGLLNDSRPWKVDQTSLSQVVDLVNQKNAGVKMRFAHPNMSRDGMGRHLGRATNARIEGDAVVVDAKLSDAAKRTPNGDLYSHVLDLASESPEDFGLSLAPVLDTKAMDEIKPDADGLTPLRFKELRAIDFVDEPAATRGGLFSLDSDAIADLPAQATWMLDTFFGEAPPDVIRGRFNDFLSTYLKSKGTVEMTTTDHTAALAEKDSEIEALKTKVAELSKVGSGDAAELAKQAARAELSRKAEIEALCKLAKVSDTDRDLMLQAGFSRTEVQDFLKSSGRLSQQNPPLTEGGTDLGDKKQTPEEKFGVEYDAHPEVYANLNLTREAYIKSRKLDK